MLVFAIILGTMLHFGIGGASFSLIQKRMKPNCRYLATNNCDGDCGHSVLAGLSVIAWPIILPVMLGAVLGAGSGMSRTDKKWAREIAEAKHQKELSRIRMEEDAFLSHQLKVLDRMVNQ